MVSFVEEWREAMDKGNVVGALFLDMSKVFDMMDHTIFLGNRVSMVQEGRNWSSLMDI